MPYGVIIPEMEKTLRPHVHNKMVWDLGAGDLGHAKHLLQMGAQKIIAVEKEDIEPGRNILPMRIYFAGLPVPPEGFEVVWLSWPPNHRLPGLERLLEAARTVIYLGSNTDGNSCGDPSLFRHLTQREILDHVPFRTNSLIVYGEHCGQRCLVGEEIGALCGRMVDFESAQQVAIQSSKHTSLA